MIEEEEEGVDGRYRYDPETTLEFWGLKINENGVQWTEVGSYTTLGGFNGLSAAGVVSGLLVIVGMNVLF